MNDTQEFKKTILKPIKTIEQIVASYMVAEIIIEIRNSLIEKNKNEIKFDIPILSDKVSDRAKDLFERAFEIMKFKPSYVYLVQLGLEDMFKYNFKDSPSVTTNGAGDTSHLQKMFATRFTDLSKINLEDHTLNVLENAIDSAERSGRASSMSLSIIAALFHDYGKSIEIRKAVLGEGIQRGNKAHAEVSFLYLQDLLFPKLYNTIEDSYNLSETTERLGFLVKNHHPANKEMREDLEISFVVNADHEARRKEFISLRNKRNN